MQGYIKLHRKMVNWEWYTDINTKTLFIHCLIMANHKPTKWRGYDVGIGEFITSLSKLSTQTGLSIQQVRTSLDKLKSTQDITQYQHSKFTMLKVLNYAMHQGKEELENDISNTISTQNVTTNQHQVNTQDNTKVTTNKNDKNLKNDKNDKKEIKEVVDYLNNVIGTSYRYTSNKTQSLINARLNEGFTYEDFVTVIDKKSNQWIGDEKMSKFLRPETLFSNKFESYLNEKYSEKKILKSMEDRW